MINLVENDTKFQKEKKLVFSPDIASLETSLLSPLSRTVVPLKITSDLLSFYNSNNLFFRASSIHTRSRFAQIGLHIESSMAERISEHCFKRVTESTELDTCSIEVFNLSRRAIYLPQGSSFFNIYSHVYDYVSFTDLNARFSSDIEIHGEEGKHWKWFRLQVNNKPELVRDGIELMLDPNYVMWVPPADMPIKLSDRPAINHNRAEVDRYLQPVQGKISRQMLWIGQTAASLFLGSNIHAEILSLTDRKGFHINSRILRGGNTSSKIRTEIVSQVEQSRRPRSIRMLFLRA